jgi:hypothetical protein
MEKRRVLGKATKRLDGAMKSTGRAKYASDFTQKDLLFGALVTSPHAHARVTSVDTSEAEKVPGVTAVRVIASAGTELMWAGQEVASVAANTEEAAKDATRKVKVQYEVLPHLVREDDLSKAGARAKSAGEQVKGDPDKAFQEADATVEGRYGIPVITHCCLESHGNVIEWKGDHIEFRPSTQNVSGIGGDLSNSIKIPASNIHVNMQYESQRRPASKAVSGPRHRIDDRRQPSVRIRQYQGGRQERRHHHGVAVGIVVDRRHRRRRQPAHSVCVRHSQPAQEPHRGGDQLRRRSRLARAQSSAGLLPHQYGARGSGGQAQPGPARGV